MGTADECAYLSLRTVFCLMHLDSAAGDHGTGFKPSSYMTPQHGPDVSVCSLSPDLVVDTRGSTDFFVGVLGL